jgi:hypothetical protein
MSDRLLAGLNLRTCVTIRGGVRLLLRCVRIQLIVFLFDWA